MLTEARLAPTPGQGDVIVKTSNNTISFRANDINSTWCNPSRISNNTLCGRVDLGSWLSVELTELASVLLGFWWILGIQKCEATGIDN